MLKCKKIDCVGCGSCEAVCPTKIIFMEKNKEGFSYPEVKKDNCIKCDLCNKVCPALVKNINRSETSGFAVQLKEINLLKECSSGGAFAGIAQEVLKKGGLVYGVASIKKELRYIRIENLGNLRLILGSKYYQCDIEKETYKEIEDISKEKLILVSGTPCQISAFKNNTKINQKNLFTFEILCQGIPSKKVIDIFNQEKERKSGKKIKKHSFRSKDRYVGRNYLNKYEYEDGEVEYYEGEKDQLSLSFQRQIFLRNSCYKCKYSNKERVADFTGGDLWKYDLKNKNIEFRDGVSILLCNNTKSLRLFETCRNFKKEKIAYELALKDNIPYHRSVKRPFSRNYSYYLLNKNVKPKVITYICCIKYYIKKLILGVKK
ncbi:MAG: Coenzyme F420 hydrogenase/dehydrogenase, beta subunit C-terminal domain [Clostridium sp.]